MNKPSMSVSGPHSSKTDPSGESSSKPESSQPDSSEVDASEEPQNLIKREERDDYLFQ